MRTETGTGKAGVKTGAMTGARSVIGTEVTEGEVEAGESADETGSNGTGAETGVGATTGTETEARSVAGTDVKRGVAQAVEGKAEAVSDTGVKAGQTGVVAETGTGTDA